MTRTHESPVGSGSCGNFSKGLAWIIADIKCCLYRCSRYGFRIETGNEPTPASSSVHLWLQLGRRSFAYERQPHLLRSALHPSALSSGKSHDHERIRYSQEQSDPLSYLASNPRPSSFTAIEISLGSQRQRTWTCFPGFS